MHVMYVLYAIYFTDLPGIVPHQRGSQTRCQ